jgi:hypothetical protein
MNKSIRGAGLLALLSLLAVSPRAAERAAPIWAGSIIAQPFEKTPFQEISIPAWVEETIGVGYTLSGQNAEQRARAKLAGVSISELGFVDPFYAYYDSKLLLKRSPYVPLDRIGKEIAEYQRLGIRILAVYPPSLQGEVYGKHPDWRRLSENTTQIAQVDLALYPHGGMLCLLGPYGDFFIDVLAEILTMFPQVDAFSFDGLHYGGVCYCEHCRANYRADTGHEIPSVNLDDPAFRRYQHWADRHMEALIQRMQTRLKGIKPGVALLTWTTNAGRYGHFRDIPRNMPARMNLLLDAPDQEFWLDESNRGATIVPAFGLAYIWALSNHRVAFSEAYLMSHGNPYGKDSFPAHEIERRMLLAVAHGVFPSIAVGQPPPMQSAIYHCLEEVQKRKPWITHKQPEPWAAILMSDNTRNFYGRASGLVEDRYLAGVFGAFRAALEEHLQFTVIADWNLNPNDLARFKVLILPNAACLDTNQTSAIREFVRNGGGLLAALDTSLCNEFGDLQPNFTLSDVFGVDYQELVATATNSPAPLDANSARTLPPDYWERRKNVWDLTRQRGAELDAPRLDALLGDQTVTLKAPAVRVLTNNSSARVIATLAPKVGPASAALPAVILNPFGKGKCAYLAAGVDSAYYLYPYPYHRMVLRALVDAVAPEPPGISVEAPLCVHAVATRQSAGGERLVIHLYNDVNTSAFHALPNEDVPLREEVLPIYGIRVTLRNYPLARLHLEPEGITLDPDFTSGQATVTIPRLDIHTMVVAELH